MERAGACHAKKCARVCAARRWKSNEDWMARTGYASAAAISGCAIAQHPCDHPQVLPAYGLQDLRHKDRHPTTKSNPNTMCLPVPLGEDLGSGHFYPAKNRTFLLCVDRRTDETKIDGNGAGRTARGPQHWADCVRKPGSPG